jgi:hypothetical protein
VQSFRQLVVSQPASETSLNQLLLFDIKGALLIMQLPTPHAEKE